MWKFSISLNIETGKETNAVDELVAAIGFRGEETEESDYEETEGEEK